MFKTNVSGPNKTWGTQKNLGTLPPNVPPQLNACISTVRITTRRHYALTRILILLTLRLRVITYHYYC